MGGFRSIDYSPDDFAEGLVKYYGSFQKVQENYFSDLFKDGRIGS